MLEPTRAEFKYLVERQREELKTVNEVGKLLSSTTDPHEIIRLIASYLRQTFPLALCGVLVVEPRKLFMIRFATISQVDVTSAVREVCAQASGHLPQPISDSSLALSFEEQTEGAGQGAQGPIGYLRSHYSAPLMFNEQLIGLLTVFSGKPDAFTKEDQRVIDIVANQLRAALRNAFLLEALRQANQLKQDLLMVISHELRIPLTSIREGVQLILDGSLGAVSTDQQDFLKTVHENTNRLESLVEKVVTATQVVAGQLTIAAQELNLATLLQELAGVFGPIAQAKGVSLEAAVSPDALTGRADAKRIKQALGYLIENAIQATPQGGQVKVEASHTTHELIVHVTDTGPGIPAEELPRIFEQFRIIGGVDNRKTGGLGLGLFLANTLVVAHGGHIDLESTVGQGTRVTVHLPKEPPTQTPAPTVKTPARTPSSGPKP